MSNYTQMDEISRRQLLSKVGDIAHNSNEFLEKLNLLIKQYENVSNSKIGLDNVTFEN